MDSYRELEEALGARFKDPRLLDLALTHPSYINEAGGNKLDSNVRLALLGDAVLGFIVVDSLYDKFPHLPQGDLTHIRSHLVSQESLAKLAIRLRLGERLLMGTGEKGSGGPKRHRNLATALEAVIGAVYLDQGLESARGVVMMLLGEEMASFVRRGIPKDFKSILQEELQSAQKGSPVYRIITADGPEHKPSFTVEVAAAGEVLGTGSGSSKQAAEREAAQQALTRLGVLS